MDKEGPRTLILDSSQSTLMYIRGYIKSLDHEFALYGLKNLCSSAAVVFFPLSKVSTGEMTLRAEGSPKNTHKCVLFMEGENCE